MGHQDAEWIERWRQGDPSAFAELVRRWQAPIGRFLVRLVGQRDLAEDLCQEVFLRVFLAGARYRETGAFKTWLYRIALNLARDAARRRRHEPHGLEEPEPADDRTPVETWATHAELAEALAQGLADLPGPLREVLILRHYEDMRFEEMARVLDVPASTLKSRFAVALGRLRVRLQQLGWNSEEIDR